MIATKFYTLQGAADALGTNRQRIAKLIELTGVTPEPIGTARVLDARAFARIAKAHRVTPFGKPGRRPPGPPRN